MIFMFGYCGDGIVWIEIGLIYVFGVLFGEEVIVIVKDGWVSYIWIEIFFEDCIVLVCWYFEICGGCFVQYLVVVFYFEWKCVFVVNVLKDCGIEVDVVDVVFVIEGGCCWVVLIVMCVGWYILFGYYEKVSYWLVDVI